MELMTKTIVRGFAAAACLAAVGCASLDIANPNEPNNKSALSDPNAIEAVGAGAIRTWFNAYTDLRGTGALVTQARSFSSSWNNGNLLTYNGVANPTDPPDQWVRTVGWLNDPAATARTSIDAFWGGGLDESATPRGGFYNSLSSANDALSAIRKNAVIINNASDTKRAETIAAFMQGASLMMFALSYDKAYIVTDSTTDAQLAALAYSSRKLLRDTAVVKLQQAIALANANTFTTPAEWTNGFAYTNVQIGQIANTMAAMTLAYYPRDSTELAGTNWAAVEGFASKGMGSGTPVDFMLVQDGYASWISELMSWFDAMDTGRMHTRVSHFLDPATQVDPWPLSGNPQPNSPDLRLGDGTFGNAGNVGSFGTVPKDAGAGTDYAWSGQAIFRPSRGFYHQSNIAQIRYDFSGDQDPQGTYGGHGPAPAIMRSQNDLLWAEALLRQAKVGAALYGLIDRTRVNRGGLPTSALNAVVGTTADGPCMSNGKLASTGGTCSLWSVLLYEKEIELPGQGPAPFWEQRRLPVIIGGGWAGDNSPKRNIQGLLPGTPREMPVPYTELGVKGEALYSWGGANPPKSPPPP
jgi:hypothetical protein